jgi:hypothetical protein
MVTNRFILCLQNLRISKLGVVVSRELVTHGAQDGR